MATVDLGRWSVAELRAIGVDACGVVQPLFRTAGLPSGQVSDDALVALRERGAVREGSDGRVLPDGPLADLMTFRALARRVTSVRPQWGLDGDDRALVLADVVDDDRVLLLEETDGVVAAWLTDAAAVADSLAEQALADVDPTVPDSDPTGWLTADVPGFDAGAAQSEPTLSLQSLQLADDGSTAQGALGLVLRDGHPSLVASVLEGGRLVRATRRVGPADVRAELGLMLSGPGRP